MEAYRTLVDQLQDPCCPHRSRIYTRLQKMWQTLLHNQQISYYCDRCKYEHQRGRIYRDHLPHAKFHHPTPSITPVSYEFCFIEKIIGIHQVGRQSYWSRIPRFHPLTFQLTPKGIGDVGIFYKHYLLGYLKNKQRPNWKQLVLNGNKLEGTLIHYFPRKQKGKALEICIECEQRKENIVYYPNGEIRYFSCENDKFCKKKEKFRLSNRIHGLKFSPPFAKVRVTGFHPQKSIELVRNLFHLIKNNYPNLKEALLALGPHEKHLLIKIINDNHFYPHLSKPIRQIIERKVVLENGSTILL